MHDKCADLILLWCYSVHALNGNAFWNNMLCMQICANMIMSSDAIRLLQHVALQ